MERTEEEAKRSMAEETIYVEEDRVISYESFPRFNLNTKYIKEKEEPIG